MLTTAEGNLQKEKPQVLFVGGTNKKRKVAFASKRGKGKKQVKATSTKKDGDDKGTCFHCGVKGHWKRNCKMYLNEKAQRKHDDALGIYMIDTYLSYRDSTSWVLDTGCTSHICNDSQRLTSKRKLRKGEVELRMGNVAIVAAVALGVVNLKLPSGDYLSLEECNYVPSIVKNIISVSCLDKMGYTLIIKDKCCSIYLGSKLVATAPLINGLYLIDVSSYNLQVDVALKKSKQGVNEAYLWHCRLGHVGDGRLQKLHKDAYLGAFDYESFATCESCIMGKLPKSPFSGIGERAKGILELIHSDVCGPMPVQARSGSFYFITFTDDFSRFGWVYLMRYKSEALEKFREFKNEVEKQSGKSIKTLRSDRGGVYLSTEFTQFLKDNGILAELTPPYTPQMNGVSERRNRTLLDMVRSMMSFSKLPISLWGYALETAARVLNVLPSKSVAYTPYEIWKGKKPDFSYFRVWGCPAHVKKHDTDKLELRTELCKFVGYPKETIGYYFYRPEEQSIFVAKRVIFLKDEYLLRRNSGSKVVLEEVLDPNTNATSLDENSVPENLQVHTEAPRRTGRVPRQPDRYVGHIVTDDVDTLHLKDSDPLTYSEAVHDSNSKKWREAMDSEIQSIHQNQVWYLVDPPEGIVPIGCKWIFKKKIGADGQIDTFKARLVAKGYRQRQGIDYDETFSPVAMIKSIRILLAIAAHYDYEVWQMDVKTAFLNGNLEEEVYMIQLEGYTSKEFPEKVCRLQRSIYGLKQASRSWNMRFDEAIRSYDFIKNEDEPCVYKKISGSAITFLVLYVDDILLIGNDVGMLSSVKAWLSKNFFMKDLGEATYVLGIRIYRDRSRRLLGLSQSMYIDTIVKRFGMENSKRGFIPMRHGVQIFKEHSPKTLEDRALMEKIPYASAIGSIMYAMLCTRPDVAFALSVTSRFQANPGESHWEAVKCILKYLRRTKDLFMVYGRGELKL